MSYRMQENLKLIDFMRLEMVPTGVSTYNGPLSPMCFRSSERRRCHKTRVLPLTFYSPKDCGSCTVLARPVKTPLCM